VIDMPTRSPDVVNEHRITLGRWEREQVKTLNEAKMVKDVGTGVGIAAVGIGGTYVAYKIGKALYDWGEDIIDDIVNSDVVKTAGGILNTPSEMAKIAASGGEYKGKSSGLLHLLTGGLLGNPAGE